MKTIICLSFGCAILAGCGSMPVSQKDGFSTVGCADCGSVAFTQPGDGYWFVYMGSAQDFLDGVGTSGQLAAAVTIAQGEVVWISLDGVNGLRVLDEATDISNSTFGVVALVDDGTETALVDIFGALDTDGTFGYTTIGTMSIDVGDGPVEISVRGRQN